MESVHCNALLGKRSNEAAADVQKSGCATQANQVSAGQVGAVRIVPGPSLGMEGVTVGSFAVPPYSPMSENPGINGVMGRSAGLEYAKLKKEEAREGFKEKRRRELVCMGEGDRTKRRRKNDMSMSEDAKYRRRLKMNQDSAAAARYAQETYVATLEDLVVKFEREKTRMSYDVELLRSERIVLERKIALLQTQVMNKNEKSPATSVTGHKGKIAGTSHIQGSEYASFAVPSSLPRKIVTPFTSSGFSEAVPSTTRDQHLGNIMGHAESNDLDRGVLEPPAAPSTQPSCASPWNNVKTDPRAILAQGTKEKSLDSEVQGMSGDGTDLKKLMDLYDPNFMMNLGLDETLDLSEDIIDMHPIA